MSLAVLSFGTLLNAFCHVPYALQLSSGWTSIAVIANVITLILIIPLMYVLTTVPLASKALRRHGTQRQPGCGLGLQPVARCFPTAGAAQAANSCPGSRARPLGGGCGFSPR